MANQIHVPIKGLGVAIIIPLTMVSGEAKLPTSVVKHKFNNLAPGTGIAIPAPASASSSKTSYLTFETVDMNTVQYPISPQTIDGLTGDIATSDSSGSNAASKITIISNDIPDNVADYKAYLKKLQEWHSTPVLICLGLGKGLDSSVTAANVGFALGIGLMSSEIKSAPDGKKGETQTIEISLGTYIIESATQTSLKGTGYLGTITPYYGSTAITLPDITQDDLDDIAAGKLCLL